MQQPTTATNIVKALTTELYEDEKMRDYLFDGNLYDVETRVRALCVNIFNGVMEQLLAAASLDVCESVEDAYYERGFRKLEVRPLRIELHTGHRVEVPSLYAKSVAEGVTGSRHILARHWSISSNCSPLRVSQVGMCSAICPSYDIGNELIKNFGVVQSVSRVRKITQDLSAWCAPREVDLGLAKGETLAGKRVILSIDGGRTRTKCHKPPADTSGQTSLRKLGYETPWCEPKLFVIQILDDNGEVSRTNRPIYGVRFGEEDVLGLLGKYLHNLNIAQAKSIQIVADGAPWIWNTMKPLLLSLGVPEQVIVETLDHAHASEYVNKIITKLPECTSSTQKNKLLKQFLSWLWDGKSLQIVKQCKTLFTAPCQELQRWINYLEKHADRTQYAHFKQNKYQCGSGIVESGIRRIINLRFKNPSTFWRKENVENLFFLRALCLSKRWDIFIQNYITIEHS